MRHATLALFLAATLTGCGSDALPDTPTEPTPVAVTESFSGTLTVNGARTHPFVANRAGTVTAQLTTLSDSAAVIGLSLGTWNGLVCQIILANDAAVLNITITGTAQATGQFCVRVQDVGMLTAPVDYTVAVTHF